MSSVISYIDLADALRKRSGPACSGVAQALQERIVERVELGRLV